MTALRNASGRTGITPAAELLEGRRLLSGSLLGQFVGNAPSELVVGTLNNRATVQVSDTSAVRESGKASVGLYVSTTPYLQGDAVLVGTVTHNLHLRPGQSVRLPFRFAAPSTLADGSDYLVAKIGGTGDFADAETGPIAVAPQPVTVVHPFVDLTGQAFAPAQQVVVTGIHPAHAMMRVVVTNQGTGPARGMLQVVADVSAKSTFDGTAVGIGSTGVRAVKIKPGGSRALVVPLTIPGNAAGGSYTLFANINPTHSIGESDYTNNIVAASGSLVVFSPTTMLGAGGGAAGDSTGTAGTGGSVVNNNGSQVTVINHGPNVTVWPGHNGGTWPGIVPPDSGGTDDGAGGDDTSGGGSSCNDGSDQGGDNSGTDDSGADTSGGDSSDTGAGDDNTGGTDTGGGDTGGTDNSGGTPPDSGSTDAPTDPGSDPDSNPPPDSGTDTGSDNSGDTGSDFTGDPGTDPGAGTDFGGSSDSGDSTGGSDSSGGSDFGGDSGSTDDGSGYDDSSDFALVAFKPGHAVQSSHASTHVQVASRRIR